MQPAGKEYTMLQIPIPQFTSFQNICCWSCIFPCCWGLFGGWGPSSL